MRRGRNNRGEGGDGGNRFIYNTTLVSLTFLCHAQKGEKSGMWRAGNSLSILWSNGVSKAEAMPLQGTKEKEIKYNTENR